MRHSLCESQVTVSVQLLPDWVIPTSSFWYMGIAVPPNPLWVPVRAHLCPRSRGWLWGIQPHWNVVGNKWLVKGRESERRFLMMGGVCWEEERVPETAFPHFCYSPKCSIIIKCAFYWAFNPGFEGRWREQRCVLTWLVGTGSNPAFGTVHDLSSHPPCKVQPAGDFLLLILEN